MINFFLYLGFRVVSRRIGNGFDDTAGIAHCQCIVGNVARDHRTGSAGDIVANRYPRQYRHVATYPHIIPYADGACILHACIT